ncbi:hypothetical protein GA0115239_109317 [Streptomyces sp. BpilaLS-43]|uniref:hypothetical protein n=1 Tax=Streptomyces sp. BpilaLS-43 TaxID=1839778 RepID=UPI00081B1FDE|nr:hypothetical protein [Streptomyces sp. BpilaLS-43]SCD82943.1 hypothetical protein GA0115239_109317 [Streptomyces sp. BpilaLS-43]
MKALLRLVLCVALVANVLLDVMDESGLQLALSICAGVTVVGSGAGLWMLRGPRES